MLILHVINPLGGGGGEKTDYNFNFYWSVFTSCPHFNFNMLHLKVWVCVWGVLLPMLRASSS